MTANFLLLDYQLPTDVRVYEFVLAGIFVFAGLFKVQVKNFEFNGSWIVRTLSFLVGLFLFFLAGTGKSLTAGSNPSVPPPTEVSSSAQPDPCTAAALGGNPQCYLSLGHAWNDLGKYDKAITLFGRADSAINEQQNPSSLWKTRAYLYRDWAYAFLGRGDCHDALEKFENAKGIFDANHEDDGGATQQGIAKAQQCSP